MMEEDLDPSAHTAPCTNRSDVDYAAPGKGILSFGVHAT
jgi:hypothetical protein